jgi:DNA-binding CsgD family transcriptional regulator
MVHIITSWEAQMYDGSPDKPKLGARQLEILVHIALGSTYKQTAHALGISKHPVHASLRKTIDKLGASGRAHAVALALCKGLLKPEMLKELVIPKELEAVDEHGTLLEQVVTYIARGYINKEIGLALGFGEQTVKNFVMSITRELGARNRAHVVTLALILGLVDFENLGL